MLSIADKLRDEVLPELGVRMEDKGECACFWEGRGIKDYVITHRLIYHHHRYQHPYHHYQHHPHHNHHPHHHRLQGLGPMSTASGS